MRLNLRLDDQARQGHIVSIDFRVAELVQLATEMTGPDISGFHASLAEFLHTADTAGSPPDTYFRNVDVLWRHSTIATPSALGCDRRFAASYNGPLRAKGGYATQGYLVLPPAWEAALLPHLGTALEVDYFAGTTHDLMVVVG